MPALKEFISQWDEGGEQVNHQQIQYVINKFYKVMQDEGLAGARGLTKLGWSGEVLIRKWPLTGANRVKCQWKRVPAY